MSSDLVSRNPNDLPSELVIIRRRTGSVREQPHSGIWKIAYADFMTAMMAFFLVMWLLNATDKQTIAAVANYFNPVKLTDRVSNPRGLHDMEAVEREQADAAGRAASVHGRAKEDLKAEGSFRPTFEEDVLFSNPHGVLEQLAAKARWEFAEADRPAEGAAGRVFRDPFHPDFRFLVAQANATELREGTRPAEAGNVEQPFSQRSEASNGASFSAESVQSAQSPSAVAELAESVSDKVPQEPEAPDSATPQNPDPRRAMETRITEEIRSTLSKTVPGKIPNVEVASTSDGILISLTDEFDFGMFAIASAEPRPELVVIMEKVAEVLKSHPGPLIVRGHTDGRPFRSKTYDNWRLSSARAHMAYLMLVRGGVDESRFERIEGHADRNLKVAVDPEAAQNRRIEILLRKAEAS